MTGKTKSTTENHAKTNRTHTNALAASSATHVVKKDISRKTALNGTNAHHQRQTEVAFPHAATHATTVSKKDTGWRTATAGRRM